MRFDILTIFPDIFDSYLDESILKRAQTKELLEIYIHDIREYSKNKHSKVDDKPYGGGPGMVMTPQPIYDCVQYVKTVNSGPVIYMSPQGETLTQKRAEKFAKLSEVILLCGRYEGIDQRILDLVVDKEVSIGKYVLTGGELPAMVFIDAIIRLVPEVLGKEESLAEETFSKSLEGKKEYPQYTRPAIFRGYGVPDILKSGHHGKIKKWRRKKLK